MIATTSPPQAKSEPSMPPATEQSAAPSPIRDFLADRDVPCPECGYNLRDAASGACPECGETLALTLRGTSPFGRRTPYVLLVFLWLLVAGAVHASQVTRGILAASSRQSWSFLSINRSGNVQAMFRNGRSTSPPIVQITPNGTTTSSAVPAPNVVVMPSRGSGGSGTLSFNWPQLGVAATPTRNWSNVGWQQWSKAGVWTAVTLTALTGLGLLWWVRKRAESSPRLVRAIPMLAWGGFGLYCATQLLGSVLGVI